MDPDKLPETYLGRLTLHGGIDVAAHTYTALALDIGKGILGSLSLGLPPLSTT